MSDEVVNNGAMARVQRQQLPRIASTPAAPSLAKGDVTDGPPQLGSVAEKSTVYWDLSKASDNDDVTDNSKKLSAKAKMLSLAMPGKSGTNDTLLFSSHSSNSNSTNSCSSGDSIDVVNSTFNNLVAPSTPYHVSATAPNLAMVASVYRGDMSPLICEDSLTGRAAAPKLLTRSLSVAKRENINILSSSHAHGNLLFDNNYGSAARDELISRACLRMAELSSSLLDITGTQTENGTGSGFQDDGLETGTEAGAGAGAGGAEGTGRGTRVVAIMGEILSEIMQAWAMPVLGRDVAGAMCNDLLERGALRVVVSGLDSDDHAVKLASAQLLSQCLVPAVRTVLADECLDVVVDLALTSMHNTPLFLAALCMLEHLMKVADLHCFRACQLDALKPILHGCSLADVPTLRHCAMALANLALFGGPLCHVEMARRHVPEWLFPLAFSGDAIVKYFAFFAISAMVSNGEVEAAVLSSGTLELVEPFLSAHNPLDFASSDESMLHGQSVTSLARVVPLLSSNRREPQSLAAFHFTMEAAIKSLARRQHIFMDIGAIEPLERLVSSTNTLASRFAAQALLLIGHCVPNKLPAQVYLWRADDVSAWLRKRYFSEAVVAGFANVRVDGDLLLRMNEDLLPEVGVMNKVEKLRFVRELEKLRLSADYSARDPSGLSDWLKSISAELSQYTYPMLHSSVSMQCLCLLTDNMLRDECGIANSVHRAKILHALTSKPQATEPAEQWFDAFISYRRSSGSLLASLLKVHLTLRKYRVYLDIETLKGGKFTENLLNSIRRSHNFILVLTHDALDRCIKDVECKDWVHREIVAALEGGCNIVPVLDQGVTMPATDSLPLDINQLSTFNGFAWVHEMQDACIDRLEQFLRRPKASSEERRFV